MSNSKIIYTQDEPMRVNKFLAISGVCSRRKAEELIQMGQIEIDGVKIADLGHKITKGSELKVLTNAQENLDAQVSIIYHKPIGIVSGQAQKDEIPAIARILPNNKAGGGVDLAHDLLIPPVGRLDKDSRGLLILSNDGILARNLIGPDSKIEKEYIVKVLGEINAQKISKLRFGLTLDGRKLKPAKVNQIAGDTLNFILQEGRNRQIRRMCAKVGLEVIDLFRIRIGNILLGDLPQDVWRHLTDIEVTNIKS